MFNVNQQVVCQAGTSSGSVQSGKIYRVKKVVKNKLTGQYGIQLYEVEPSPEFLYFKAERFKAVRVISTMHVNI